MPIRNFGRVILRAGLTAICGSLLAEAREGPVPLSSELRRAPIQLGVQFMTGYRSNYVFRGEKLGEQVVEAQMASSFAVDNDWALAGELDFVRGFFNKDFTQLTLYGELQYYLSDESTIGPSLAGQFYNHTVYRSGCEPGLVWRWSPVPDWAFVVAGVYDSGQKGFYGNAAVTWQPLITPKTAWENTVSLGTSASYLDADGPSDLMIRTGLLIRMGAAFRLQPFVGMTFGLGDKQNKTITVGAWFTWVY